jgi:hypothetical protein
LTEKKNLRKTKFFISSEEPPPNETESTNDFQPVISHDCSHDNQQTESQQVATELLDLTLFEKPQQRNADEETWKQITLHTVKDMLKEYNNDENSIRNGQARQNYASQEVENTDLFDDDDYEEELEGMQLIYYFLIQRNSKVSRLSSSSNEAEREFQLLEPWFLFDSFRN